MIFVTRTSFVDLPDVLKSDLMTRQQEVDSDQVVPDVAWKAFKKSERTNLNVALRGDFHGKCVYCETGLDEFSADVEHFWPKSPHNHNRKRGMPKSEPIADNTVRQSGQHGMFVWANLMWSCKTCNGFECKASHMKWNSIGQTELLNPCRAEDDPFQHLHFCVDLNNKIEVGRVYSKQDLIDSDHNRAAYTISRLKLDKRDSLVRERKEKIKQFGELIWYFRKYGSDEIGPNGKTIGENLIEFLGAKTRFLAPIRQILFDPAYAQDGYDSLYAELKTKLAGLDQVLLEWNAFPPQNSLRNEQ